MECDHKPAKPGKAEAVCHIVAKVMLPALRDNCWGAVVGTVIPSRSVY